MGLLTDLGVAALIDEACGPRPSGLALSPGTYLALTVLTRVVDPCSKRGFADWWRTTAADRFTKIATSTLDHRRFWDALHAVPWTGWRRSRRSWRWASAPATAWIPARWP